MTKRPNPQPTTRRARMKRRRLGQVRRAKAAYRDRQRERLQQAEQQRRQQGRSEPRWRRPDPPKVDNPCGADYGSRVPAAAEAPTKPKRRKRAPAKLRRAVRAEPDDRVHGPNRGGESANSWSRPEDRSPTKLPVDVADFMREEF